MILDNIYTTLADYGGINPKIARAIDWVRGCNLTDLEPEKMISIDGDRVRAKIQIYPTTRPEEASFEVHRLHIDLQMIVSGRETVQWAPLSRLPDVHTPYNYENDVVFFQDPQKFVPIHLEAGDFVILFPSDGHKPKCATERPEKVTKLVVKITV